MAWKVINIAGFRYFGKHMFNVQSGTTYAKIAYDFFQVPYPTESITISTSIFFFKAKLYEKREKNIGEALKFCRAKNWVIFLHE